MGFEGKKRGGVWRGIFSIVWIPILEKRNLKGRDLLKKKKKDGKWNQNHSFLHFPSIPSKTKKEDSHYSFTFPSRSPCLPFRSQDAMNSSGNVNISIDEWTYTFEG